MQPRTPLPKAAITLIKSQEGIITTRQLVRTGLSERVVERITKPWTRLARGLYLTGEPTWEAAAWAGVLHAVGGAGVVGGEAACYLHKAVRDAPARLMVWTRDHRRGFPVGSWAVEFRRGSRKSRGSPSRSSLEVSLLDMANVSSETATVAAVSRALAQNLTTSSRILRTMRQRSRVRHSVVIRELCAESGVESVLEWLFLRDVIRAHGLPEPVLQHSTSAGRVDGFFPGHDLVLELDGMRDHMDWSKDMLRDNEHVLEGRRAMRFGFHAATRDRCPAASQLATALGVSARACANPSVEACPP